MSAAVYADPVAEIARFLLPRGGFVTVQCQAFFDESGSHGGSPILCVAGYVFQKSAAIKLGREWRKVLNWKKLSAFHMVDCAHGNEEFGNLSKPERIAVETRMIEIIKRHAVQGIAITINEGEFSAFVEQHPNIREMYGTAYAFCIHAVLAGVAGWLRVNDRVGKMAYFFEAGHASASQANGVMQKIFQQAELYNQYRYGGHAFVEKKRSPAIQAADLLAWQWFKDKKNQLEGRPRRQDCVSLLQKHHAVAHFDRRQMEIIVSDPMFRRAFPGRESPARVA